MVTRSLRSASAPTLGSLRVVLALMLVLCGVSSVAGRDEPWVAAPAAVPLAPAKPLTRVEGAATLGRLPLAFEPNRGQAEPSLRYLAHSQGGTVGIQADGGMVLRPGGASHPPLRMRLAGANTASLLAGEAELPGKVSYMRGADRSRWQMGLPTYGKVRARGVYPGTDLVYHGRDGHLEYDLELAPGAGADRIRLAFSGCDALRVDEHGELVLTQGGSEVRHHAPEVYQDIHGKRQRVTGAYTLREGGEVGFRLGVYDRSRALVIDPVLSFSTYLGGANFEDGEAIATDSSGGIIVVGGTDSTDFPATNINQGGSDAFVTKISADKTRAIFSLYVGGSGSDRARAVAVDNAAGTGIYVAGATSSSDFPVSIGGGQLHGPSDGFVLHLNSDGSAAQARLIGGEGTDKLTAIALRQIVLASGSAAQVCVAGSTDSSFGGQRSGSDVDGFLAIGNFNSSTSNASFQVVSFVGGTLSDEPTGVALLSDGKVAVVGRTLSTDLPVLGVSGTPPLQRDQPGQDAFVGVFQADSDPTSVLYVPRWLTYLGGRGSDEANGVAVDSRNNLYVAGSTDSTDFPVFGALGVGVFGRRFTGLEDAFVTKLNSDGTRLLYSGLLASDSIVSCKAVAVDGSGVAWITGRTVATSFPEVNPLPTLPAPARQALFVTAISADGSAIAFSTKLGPATSSSTEGRGIAVRGPFLSTSNGTRSLTPTTVYVAGNTNDPGFPMASPLQANVGGHDDAFVLQINSAVGAGLSGAWRRVAHSHRVSGLCPVSAQLEISNPGIYATIPTVTRIYLSADGTLDSGDTLLKELKTPALQPKHKVRQSFSVKVANCGRGQFLIAVADATNLVEEPNEENNVVVFGPIQ